MLDSNLVLLLQSCHSRSLRWEAPGVWCTDIGWGEPVASTAGQHWCEELLKDRTWDGWWKLHCKLLRISPRGPNTELGTERTPGWQRSGHCQKGRMGGPGPPCVSWPQPRQMGEGSGSSWGKLIKKTAFRTYLLSTDISIHMLVFKRIIFTSFFLPLEAPTHATKLLVKLNQIKKHFLCTYNVPCSALCTKELLKDACDPST